MPIRQLDKKALFSRAGNRCSFPGCGQLLISESGILFGQICHIEAMSAGGPRYYPNKSGGEVSRLDNLIALCPTHHQVIDAEPLKYTADWLRSIKAQHEENIAKALASSDVKAIDLSKVSPVSFVQALKMWHDNEDNDREEFWQKFFEENPRIIAQAIPNHVVKLGQKCYVGGKSLDNQGGNLIDLLYLTQSNRNVILVEIKTPTTKLIGRRYRTNAFSLTEEITGAVVQVLNYRDELLKNYYAISGQNPEWKFSAFNPRCLVVAGNLRDERPDSVQRKSFDLFRSNSSLVDILTFDELFGKVEDLVDILS